MTSVIRQGLRRRVLLLTLIMGTALLLVSPAIGQDLSRTLVWGTTISDTLSPERTALTFVFDGAAGSSATLRAVSQEGVLHSICFCPMSTATKSRMLNIPALLGATIVDDAQLSAGGRYVVVVFFAPGSLPAATTIDLSLEGGATETSPVGEDASDDLSGAADSAIPAVPEQVLIAAGIEVRLSWSGLADLNLQVRDPSGETLYWDSRVTTNGGVFGFDANGLCDVISPNPVETATWQPGFLPTGSYEILVFYREACDASAGSLPFNVQVRVDGVVAGTIDGTLSPPTLGQDSVHIARFVVDGAGGATVNAGALYTDASLTRLPSGFDIATDAPTPITSGVSVTGAISNASPYVTYSFAGAAGDVVALDMVAVGPNLDTLLQIVDANGALVSVNDDAIGTTNSSISNLRLLTSGTYTIIASRYGKEIGGTEGQFLLTLAGAADEVSTDVTGLDLPAGDIEVTLLWRTSADLQLLVRDPVGGVVFDDIPLSASGGELVAAGNVNCVPAASGAPVSYIYWPPGRMRPGAYEVEVWYQNTCEDIPPAVEFTLVVSVRGQQIALERQFPLPNQRFVTNFTIMPDGGASRGDGGFIDGGSQTLPYQAEALDAPIIASGQTVSGTITPSNTFDVYSFQGAAGDTVTIRMSAATSVLDTSLFLISPSFLEIAANDDGNPALLGTAGRSTDSIISNVVLLENGPYTIIATRFGMRFGGTIGNYSLTLEQN